MVIQQQLNKLLFYTYVRHTVDLVTMEMKERSRYCRSTEIHRQRDGGPKKLLEQFTLELSLVEGGEIIQQKFVVGYMLA